MKEKKEKRWIVCLFRKALSSPENEYKVTFDSIFKNEERAKRYAFIKNILEDYQFDENFGYEVREVKALRNFKITDKDREEIMEIIKDKINSIGHIREAKIDIIKTIEALKGILSKEQIKELHKEIRELD